jgi:hypothetical protein
MKCYICDQLGKDSPAVAICIVCGMGLCKDHVIREELPMWERMHQGMAETKVKLPATLPRILCPPCSTALHQSNES